MFVRLAAESNPVFSSWETVVPISFVMLVTYNAIRQIHLPSEILVNMQRKFSNMYARFFYYLHTILLQFATVVVIVCDA